MTISFSEDGRTADLTFTVARADLDRAVAVLEERRALLGFAATLNKDAVGLLLFSDDVELFVPPKKGRGQIHRILRDIYYFPPRSKRTSIANAVSYLQGVLKKRSHIFVFSDFLDEGFQPALRMLGRKHDVVAVVVKDPIELQLPKLGLVDFEDPESGEIVTIIWATGYRPDYSWLDVMVLDRKGMIRHDGGVVDSPGMYLIGSPFLRRRKSSFIDGARVDAQDLIIELTAYLDRRASPVKG